MKEVQHQRALFGELDQSRSDNAFYTKRLMEKAAACIGVDAYNISLFDVVGALESEKAYRIQIEIQLSKLISDCWKACGGNGPADRDSLLTALRLMDESEKEQQAKIDKAVGLLRDAASYVRHPDYDWDLAFSKEVDDLINTNSTNT